jgi:hypothetical protein
LASAPEISARHCVIADSACVLLAAAARNLEAAVCSALRVEDISARATLMSLLNLSSTLATQS